MIKTKILHKFRIGVLIVVIVFLLFATNPEQLPLPLLVLPFLLLFILLHTLIGLLLKKRNSGSLSKNRKIVLVTLSALPVLILILQSIGQLSIRDFLILAGLGVGIVFYFVKTDQLQ